MSKSCDNCYWEGYKNMFCINKVDRPVENICNKHSWQCTCEDIANYKYKGKYYCSECLLKEFDVEESTTTHYYLDGEHIGTDEDMDEVIRNLDNSIESI